LLETVLLRVAVFVSPEHQHGNRGTARMRAMPEIGARIDFEGEKRVTHKRFVRAF
jgi:hypothetical protein